MSLPQDQIDVRTKVWWASQEQEGLRLNHNEVGALWESVFDAAKTKQEMNGLLVSAYTFLSHFVSVIEAQTDGFDVEAWCQQAEALGIRPDQ